MILQAGILISEPNKNGWTPLHVAVRRGDAEACAMLCEYGADARAGHEIMRIVPRDIVMHRRDAIRAIIVKHLQATGNGEVGGGGDGRGDVKKRGKRRSHRPRSQRRV